MNTDVNNQIMHIIEHALNSKHGPLYVGVLAITGLSLGYVYIESKYGILDADNKSQLNQIVTEEDKNEKMHNHGSMDRII